MVCEGQVFNRKNALGKHMPKHVLVFAAHPDDDLIGCGGSLAKHVKLGNRVSICYLTSGEAGSLEHSKQELAKIREGEAKKAAKIIGFTDVIFLRNRDGYLEYSEPILRQLVDLIRNKQPHIVYLHHHLDAHEDHKVTSRLVNEAIGRASVPIFQEYKGQPWSVKTVLAYEVWTPLAEFNYVEDISEFVSIKIAALKKHQSQIKIVRYDEAVEGLTRYRGAMTGKGKHCEVFAVNRVTDLF
jgi:LmbE family N-acetylglucosaminyl deacetylase